MKSYLKLITAMLVFGSIGLFVKAIPLPSNEIVLVRSLGGGLFMLTMLLLTRPHAEPGALRRNLPLMVASGVVMGFNWVFLFEAYRYTSVSVATVAYYCAPLMVMLACALLLGEKLTGWKLAGIAAAMAGMVLINGASLTGSDPVRGMLYGLLAAVLYAAVTVMTKFFRGVAPLQATTVQMFSAAVVVGGYVLMTHEGPVTVPSGWPLAALIILAIVHTGIACYLYFCSVRELPGQTVALLSFIDPLSALVFSAIFLDERLAPLQLIGALLVLGGAAAGELLGSRRRAAARQ